jgi:hypothetical protein
MINWNIINNKQFEDLSYKYISSKYPDLNWESTKYTRDGNKDGEANYEAPLDISIKYWYEAKYSKTPNKSIPKSHLDSTLVSSMLDGKVMLIAFITNAYISDDYRRRADTFSKQRDNLKIIYVNGDELENWLSENPDVETEYFLINTAECQNLKDYIKNVCVLQNYDLGGHQFSKSKNIECRKEYLLYLSFYSTTFQTNSVVSKDKNVELVSNYNKKYDNYDSLESVPGFNSFYIPIKINSITKAPLLFEFRCSSGTIEFGINDISIVDMYNPKIIYGSQINIQNNLFSIINDRDTTNALFYIIGNAGFGKSYLLNDIYQNNLNPFSSYVFGFTGEIDRDTITCYKIILSTLYGDIWEYLDDDCSIEQFNEIESFLIHEIKSSTANHKNVDMISSYYQKNKTKIEKNITQTQIFIDDFHKLSHKNMLLLKDFFEWFLNQRYNCKVFIFSRPEAELFCPYTKKMTIKNIEPNDVEATIINNFKGQHKLHNLIKKYPIPLNALHFLNLLCQIHSIEEKIQNKTDLELQIQLNEIYDKSSKTTCLSFGNQILSKYNYNSIVYCVYKINSGIHIDAICDYFGEKSYDEIYDLCQKRIIKESADILYPYHDILVSAFDAVNITDMNIVLEKFVLFAQEKNYISKSKMFSILIGIGKQCFWKYRNEACIYRDELHENADYYQALEIAKTLKDSNKKSFDSYDLMDCKNQFIMANCIKYTHSYEKANLEFAKLKDIYKLTNNFDIYGVYLEAETEIINNLIWMLELKSAKKRIEKLLPVFIDLYSRKQIVGHNMVYAFLNCYNRTMFLKYMLDEGNENDYNNAIMYSKALNCIEYEAFAKMDFAKSLYYHNLILAKKLMNESLIMLNGCNEKRRALDAEAENCFIDDIINKTISRTIYIDLINRMKQNHYIQSEIKTRLKLIMLNLLFSDLPSDEIRNQLDSVIINNSAISSGRRHQAFINHLYAASYYKENNIIMSKKYTQKCLNLMKEMGDSYKLVHQKNYNLTKFEKIITLNEISDEKKDLNGFIMDIRMW